MGKKPNTIPKAKYLFYAWSYEILKALNDADRALPFGEVVAHTNASSTTILRLRQLKKLGLVERDFVTVGDREVPGWKITEKGRKALRLVEELETLLSS